jgi:hypothetical protein
LKGVVELTGNLSADGPVSAVKFLDEPNTGDRALTPEEFDRMLELLPHSLKPVLL